MSAAAVPVKVGVTPSITTRPVPIRKGRFSAVSICTMCCPTGSRGT
jgi:hypothetical protein